MRNKFRKDKLMKSFVDCELLPRVTGFDQCVLTQATANFEKTTYTGAVYRMDGSLILESLRPSGIGHWRPVDPITIDKTYPHLDHPLIEEAIYGGTFFSMWGHFLLETLSTAYAAREYNGIPALFTEFSPSILSGGVDYYWNLFLPVLRAAGWTQTELKLVKGPVKFNRLFIPERLALHDVPPWQESMSPVLEETFQNIRKILGERGPANIKVFAKRPNKHLREHPAEQDLAHLLMSRGYVIADVVNMSPVSQVQLFSKAKVIVGFSGSNLHNSLFSSNETKIFEIADERSYTDWHTKLNTNQISMCALMGQCLHLVESYAAFDGNLARPLDSFEIAEQIEATLRA